MAEAEDEEEPSPQTKRTLPWWLERLELLTKIAGLLAVLIAVLFYSWDRLSRIDLEVDHPLVIEFRCQTVTFKAEDCFRPGELYGDDKGNRQRTNFSISAALRMTALGPSVQSVIVEDVTARVSFPNDFFPRISGWPEPVRRVELKAFWTGSLTGGEGKFEQVISETVQGGRSIRREYWLMPFPRQPECQASKLGSDSCDEERRDFVPWFQFIQSTYAAASEPKGGEAPEISVVINVDASANGRRSLSEEIACSVRLGGTALLNIRSDGANRPMEVLYLTLPCRPVDPSE